MVNNDDEQLQEQPAQTAYLASNAPGLFFSRSDLAILIGMLDEYSCHRELEPIEDVMGHLVPYTAGAIIPLRSVLEHMRVTSVSLGNRKTWDDLAWVLLHAWGYKYFYFPDTLKQMKPEVVWPLIQRVCEFKESLPFDN